MAAEPAVLFPDLEGHWFPVRDGDPRVADMYTRHYSYRPYKDNRRRLRRQQNFAGKGETIVLLTATGDAGYVWRRCKPTPEMAEKYGWQTGIACAFFRNEGPVRSSDLIREAMDIAWRRWPGERLFTFVEDAKVASENPGSCYRHAGWTTCGRNADGRLTILERLPLDGSPSSPNASGYCTARRGAECSRCHSSRLEREGSHGPAANR